MLSKTIIVSCDACGKKLSRKPWQIKHKHHFCDKVCRAKWQSVRMSGENNPAYVGATREYTCENCGEMFPRDYRQGAGRFCSNKCKAEYCRGENSPMYGKILPSVRKRIKTKCTNCGVELERRPSEIHNVRSFCTHKCYSTYSRGENSLLWKGVERLISAQLRMLPEYRQWRKEVFDRDKYICKNCGYDKGNILQAHHIVFQDTILEEQNIMTIEQALDCNDLWDIKNGITLCKTCHIDVHKIEKILERRVA